MKDKRTQGVRNAVHEEESLHVKRAQQKAKIRQMVGILDEKKLGNWKSEKEEYLAEKYQ
jgi:hypothetical protein